MALVTLVNPVKTNAVVKITKRDVNRAGTDYTRLASLYGEHDQGAIRALIKYQEMKEIWGKQNKGKVFVNPVNDYAGRIANLNKIIEENKKKIAAIPKSGLTKGANKMILSVYRSEIARWRADIKDLKIMARPGYVAPKLLTMKTNPVSSPLFPLAVTLLNIKRTEIKSLSKMIFAAVKANGKVNETIIEKAILDYGYHGGVLAEKYAT